MRRLRELLIVALLRLVLPCPRRPGAGAELSEGSDYDAPRDAAADRATGKVEVTEFFSYGCSHCYDFEPVLGKWVKSCPPRTSPSAACRWCSATAGRRRRKHLLHAGGHGPARAAARRGVQRHPRRAHRPQRRENPARAGWRKRASIRRSSATSTTPSPCRARSARAKQMTQAYGIQRRAGDDRSAASTRPLDTRQLRELLKVVDGLIAKIAPNKK